jgi:type II secretory pathway component GspD/PulD (secretin)
VKCDDYLAMLATLPVEELAYGQAREHAAECHDCDRVTRVVAEREHNMRMAFEDLQFSVPAPQTAAAALTASRRRKVAISYNIGLGIATVATVLFVMVSRTVSVPRPSQGQMITETFRLQCLSPVQAAELLRPSMQRIGLIHIRDESLGVIDVVAPEAAMATARSILDRYDNPAQSQCAVQVTVPKVP